MDREAFERIAALEVLAGQQGEILKEMRADIKLLLTFRAALLAVSAFVSGITALAVSVLSLALGR